MAIQIRLPVGMLATGGLALLLASFVSCFGSKDRRQLKNPSPSPVPALNTQVAANALACEPLSTVFLTEVWAPVVAPSCVRCHGQGGVGAGSAFALPVAPDTAVKAPFTKLQVHDLMQVWRGVGTGENLVATTERLTGARYHGGGTLFDSAAPQLAGLARFDVAAAAQEDCVNFSPPKRQPVGSGPKPSQLPAATLQACARVFQAFKASTLQVMTSTCAGCHGKGAGGLSLGVTSPAAGQETVMFESLMAYALAGKAQNLVDKPTMASVVPHGGDQQVTPGSPEAAALQSFVSEVGTNTQALRACLSATQASPSESARVWGP